MPFLVYEVSRQEERDKDVNIKGEYGTGSLINCDAGSSR